MSAVFKTEAEVPSSSAISRRVGSRQAVEGVVGVGVKKEDQKNQHARYMIKTEEAAPVYTPTLNEIDERQIRLKATGRAYAVRGTAEFTGVRNNTGMIIHGKKEELEKERDEDNQWIEFFENCTGNSNNLPDSVSSSTRNRIFMEDSSMINNNKNKNTLVWGDGTKTSGLLANTCVQQQQQQQANVTTTITTVADGSNITGRKRKRDYATYDDDYDNINANILYDEDEDDDGNDHHGHNGGDDDEEDNENGMSSSLESHLKKKMRHNSCDDNNNISDIGIAIDIDNDYTCDIIKQEEENEECNGNMNDNKNDNKVDDGSNIINPRKMDILCGRGAAVLKHPGNVTYRRVVNLNKELYMTCLRYEKLKVSLSIVAAIRKKNGRFLERNTKLGVWCDIGDKKAIEKTSQALREGQSKLRKQMVERGQIRPDGSCNQRQQQQQLSTILKEVSTAAGAAAVTAVATTIETNSRINHGKTDVLCGRDRATLRMVGRGQIRPDRSCNQRQQQQQQLSMVLNEVSTAAVAAALATTIETKNVINPRETDVLCGRGGAALKHPGNKTYQQVVSSMKGLYATCPKSEKNNISRSIVATIQGKNGRFLERNTKLGVWCNIGNKKAIEKTSQALREGQSKLRKHMVEMGQIPSEQLVGEDETGSVCRYMGYTYCRY